MRRTSLLIAIAAAATLAAATPALFSTAGESKWTVSTSGKPIAMVTLLTDGKSVRAEWKPAPSGATVVFIGAANKLWARAAGGDIELSAHRGEMEKAILPALLLPFTTGSSDKVTSNGGKVSQYTFSSSRASYTYDKSGPSQVKVQAAGKEYTLTRTSLGKPATDATLFAVKPRKSAVGQMSRLAGDLFGQSDTRVSATAGARGVGRGTRLADGGDYAALETVETREAERKAKLEKALAEFQKEGKVGQGREDSR